jgi:hypothetical protein
MVLFVTTAVETSNPTMLLTFTAVSVKINSAEVMNITIFWNMKPCSLIDTVTNNPPKRWQSIATLHGVTCQKIVTFIVTAIRSLIWREIMKLRILFIYFYFLFILRRCIRNIQR